VTTTAPRTFTDIEEIFAQRLPGYTPRPAQRDTAARIGQAISDEGLALIEAGTGTGKSFAGLIPAVLSGKRTVVGVPVKALQDQYIGDLRFLAQFLDFTWAILKGRSNYFCRAQAEALQAPNAIQREVMRMVADKATETGDRSEFPPVPNEDWSALSISAAECPGRKNCPFGKTCFAEQAKDRAADADIVVTNLAYLLTDLVLRSQTAGTVSLLGDFDQLIVDEAHELEDAVTKALEDSIGVGAFIRLARDTDNFLHDHGLKENGYRIQALATAMWDKVERIYANWMKANQVRKPESMPLPLSVIMDSLGDDLGGLVNAIAECRAQVLAFRADEDSKFAKYRMLRKLDNWRERLMAFATDEPDKTVRWVQQEEQLVQRRKEMRTYLRSAPVHAAPFLRANVWEKMPAVLMSATLAVGGDFGYISERLGLDTYEPATFITRSPFDYAAQAMVYVPSKDMPIPSGATSQAWRTYAQQATRELVTRARGGALLLFTSRVGMNDTYRVLADDFRAQGLTVLRQGDAESPELIRRFKEGNAVLFGLRTFFQGIDVQGEACRLVVIDKLPFAVPTDVLVQARYEAYERRFGMRKSFSGMSIPTMALVLIQGFGRLIRHVNDRGVVAILDPRLESKGYGRQIMSKLPPAPVTTDISKAAAFLQG
jgi:ATP-dependent DNA helicase DinG